MCNFISPTTINILGGGQTGTYQTDFREQTDSKPSRWDKFKTKVKRVWKNVMAVAEDVKENIMPIVTGIGSFLTSWATFCNRRNNCGQQGRIAAWSL